jgi:hypothetical protein
MMRLCAWASLLVVSAVVCIASTAALSGSARGSEGDGFQRVSGEHIDIVTDLPLDDSIRELPKVFDAAIPEWCRIFKVDPAEAKQWRATAYLMVARQRFAAAGFLPASLPPFPHGYQWDNDMWVVEQASQYYRRHLLLHEGTHWFMFRKYGSAGPPWLMEGLAEWLATHRWQNGALQMGIIPNSREDVPLWGRIPLIQQQLSEGLAPSMATILRYDGKAHQSPEAYAWSWAMVVFLRNDPSTQAAFNKLLDGPISSDATPTNQLLRSIQTRRPLVRAEWSVMLTGLDYGFNPQRELVELDHRTEPLAQPTKLTVSAARGWQTTGLQISTGQKFRVTASGRYVIGTTPKAWLCEAPGVTLRYRRGQPLGKLLLAIATPQAKEPEFSEELPIEPVGADATITAASSGQILLRINETGAELDDNSGELSVMLSPAP